MPKQVRKAPALFMETATKVAKKINSQYMERRTALSKLSTTIKLQMKMGLIDAPSINAALIELYNQEGHSNFKTFNQWKALGKSIIKGSRAFTVWGSPINSKPDPQVEQDEFQFFPLCYLFSEQQVTDSNAN